MSYINSPFTGNPMIVKSANFKVHYKNNECEIFCEYLEDEKGNVMVDAKIDGEIINKVHGIFDKLNIGKLDEYRYDVEMVTCLHRLFLGEILKLNMLNKKEKIC